VPLEEYWYWDYIYTQSEKQGGPFEEVNYFMRFDFFNNGVSSTKNVT
jgi:hypothetical protein